MENVKILEVACSAIAAIAVIWTILLLYREQKKGMRKDFLLWAMERLRDERQREGRRKIFLLAEKELSEIREAIRLEKDHECIDAINKVCLAFDEIGYFIYKEKLVGFSDILDLYPQTIKIWNKVRDIVCTWRDLYKDETTFAYFEMLATQKRYEPDFSSAKAEIKRCLESVKEA